MTELKIAYGTSRLAKYWKNTTISWEQLVKRLAKTHRTSETVAQYRASTKAQQGEIKDIGGFVGGHLAGGRRRKGQVLSRHILTLDIDHATPAILSEIKKRLAGIAYVIYSTHSHREDSPRYRLIIPLTVAVKPEAYEAIARQIAADIGIDAFDDTTYEAHRLMYWPSTPADGNYVFIEGKGEFIDPAKVLAKYDNWKDVSTWPISSRQIKAFSSTKLAKQADPLAKPGIVGAFCKTYTIVEAIETYLVDVYRPSMIEGRYDYVKGESAAGLVIYEDKFAYSHHATDPAGGKLLNAFDLVRIHLYGELDKDLAEDVSGAKTPSYVEMQKLVLANEQVKELLGAEQAAKTIELFDVLDEVKDANWRKKLSYVSKGKQGLVIEDTVPNLVLIIANDEKLSSIAYNELRDGIDVRCPNKLPWKQAKPGWTDADFAQLKNYIQKIYGLYSPTKTLDALTVAAAKNSYHPIKDYLEALDDWDGIERIDYILQDYLGAEDNAYTRQAMAKTLIAAVARIYQPGIKYDMVLTLVGVQGCGKSTLFSKLGMQWFTDSLTVTDMRDKTGAEKLQGYWIAELSELAGIRKTDAETVKSFITRTDDKYRAAYGRNVESHPRQSVIVATTNAENGFLQDITGNRRINPVTVSGKGGCGSPWNLTSYDIDQFWAEAKLRYEQGESLHLSSDVINLAKAAQAQAMESDEREGIIQEFLNTPIPADFDEWELEARRDYFIFKNTDTDSADLVERQSVSNLAIWVECFGRKPSELTTRDSYRISAIMTKLSDWEKTGTSKRCKAYGKQRIYERKISASAGTKPRWNKSRE